LYLKDDEKDLLVKILMTKKEGVVDQGNI